MLFGRKSKLYKALDTLAIYNDKGIAWSRHTPEQTRHMREDYVAEIDRLVEELGPSSLPQLLLDGLESGAVATDLTGVYAQAVKEHFGRTGGL
jgi:hypothetical protein